MATTRQAVNLAAADWFVRVGSEDVTAEELAAFDRWMDVPAHAVAYARVEASWERSEKAKAIGAPPETVIRRFSIPISRRAAAASFLTIAAGGAATWLGMAKPIYRTQLGERKTFKLADGSGVDLNTSSRLTVAYGQSGRNVRLLAGEAMFEVAKDATRPFVVHTDVARIRAVGTAFNVRLRKKAVQITVTEGIVSVDNLTGLFGSEIGQSETLSAGDEAIVGRGPIKERRLDGEALQREIAWREGVIDLRGETLGQAVEEFNRYTTRKLVVGDPALAGIRIGGTFGVHESDKFVVALREGFNVKSVEGNDGVVYLVPNT